MMDLPTLHKVAGEELQAFIQEHEKADERKLVLKSPVVLGVPSAIVADQIRGRRKSSSKLPLYYNTRGIIYPPSVNLEQSSSEAVAQFHSTLLSSVIEQESTTVDLTGGFGVDSFFVAGVASSHHYVEPDAGMLDIARHNHKQLGRDNIHYHTMTAEEFLSSDRAVVSAIFLDPSRRNNSKKVFKFSDSRPNAIELLPLLLTACPHVFIKASPMLDIQQSIRDLKNVRNVYVIENDYECKELLFHCERDWTNAPIIQPVILKPSTTSNFSFVFSEEQQSSSEISSPLEFLYEPGPAMLKTGAFKLIGERYHLSKVATSTHLYTSSKITAEFPGRIFRIQHLNPKTWSAVLPDLQANILVRNYPLTVEQLKKKYRFRDGGDNYVIGFKGEKEIFLALTTRVQ